VERYVKRIPWGAGVTELSEGAALPPAPPGSRTVVLDERGTALSSDALARKLGQWRDEGIRETRFLLGPADGHRADTRDAADLVLALGPATWPHLLARAMLAEQLYRAWSILAGHPYHRD
jgi:23S rRNA (pseudouridine1915-N3)-methyltransferase